MLVAVGSYFFPRDLGKSPSVSQESAPTPTATPQPEIVVADTWKSYSVPEAGLSFSAPAELTVTSEVQKKEGTNQPASMTLYVQNADDSKEYYQLYGTLQWDTPYPDDVLELRKDELSPETVSMLTTAGKPALRGQIKGVRNRFVTYIKLDIGLLSLFTAEPTPENEQLSNEIIETFQFE